MFDWYDEFKTRMVLLDLDSALKMLQIINMIRIMKKTYNDEIVNDGLNRLLEMNANTNLGFKNLVEFTRKIETEGCIFSQLDLYEELDLLSSNHDLQQMHYLNMLNYITSLGLNLSDNYHEEQISKYIKTNDQVNDDYNFNDSMLKLLRLERDLNN